MASAKELREAHAVISLDDRAALSKLEDHWEIQLDPSKVLTFEDMTDSGHRDGFRRPPWTGSLGYQDAALWVRFTVRRPFGVGDDWLLVLGVPFLTEIQVYGPVAGGRAVLGSSVPLRERPLRITKQAVPLILKEGESAKVYLRIWTHGVLNVSGAILPQTEAMETFELQTFLNGLFLGALLLATLVNIAVGLWTRDGTVLVYAAYLTTLFGLFLGSTGVISVLFPTLGALFPSMLVAGCALAGIPAVLMLWARIFRFWSWNRPLSVLYGGVSLGALAVIGTLGSSWYGRLAPPYFLLTLGVIFIGFAVTIRARWKGHGPDEDWWFIAALAFLVLSVLALLLTNIGFLPATMVTTNAYLIGAVLHAILVNVGLAGRLRKFALAHSKAEQRALYERRKGEEQRQFIAMLVHEFRSPLASIDRAAQMIEVKKEGENGPSVERLGRIRRLVDRLSVLVDSFLASEALEHGGVSLDRREEGVLQMLQDLANGLVEGDGSAAGVSNRLTLAVNPKTLTWELDREMAMTAIGNIISNALKYSGQERVVVEAFIDSRDNLRVTVTDRGPGLSLEDRERMGDLYYRGSAASGIRGTGLGLTITRKVMAAHGGDMMFQAAPEGGTRVVLTFPPVLSDEELFS
ncbi:ATP-binding protein [Rhodospirillum sp. A1_3_36]|uniref:sensor histidine kinase n=1 Tax=Rhodospirillum sp. A1_3_36 TaxID=3391666 RepID=UPI0039A625E9